MRRTGWALLVGVCIAAHAGGAKADEAVYRRTDPNGRAVYTNIGNVSVNGVALEALDLPALTRVDMAAFTPDELSRLDARIGQAHADLRAGPRCDALRQASRASLRNVLWSQHQRELLTSAVLFVFSLAVGFAFRSRTLRALLPVAPFLGSLYLGFVAATRAQETLADVHLALRACGAELPDANPGDPAQVKQRLMSTLDLKKDIDRVFEHRAHIMDAALARSLQ